ncbi:MAG: guanine deaminase [Polyangiales bacterium]
MGEDARTRPVQAYRASLLDFVDDPAKRADAHRFVEDGLLLVQDGRVLASGPYASLSARLGDHVALFDHTGCFLVPGFIDAHVHFPQTEMVGAYGEELLTWLETYTYPTERAFADEAYARAVARVFLRELLRHGTTSALVFASVHKASAVALFDEARALNLRIIAGKVLMDRNAPAYLCDTPESGFEDSRALIEAYHGQGRLRYAVTPRFAPTSSPAQLRAARRLLDAYPDCHLHTHVAENLGEVAWATSLFAAETPPGTSYLGVYEHFGLLTERAVFAHGVHLEDRDFALLSSRGSAIAFCPTSNLFLGSGLFPLARADAHGVKVGMGTDIGAGTSFSLLQTLNEAYKVVKLQGGTLSALRALYLATLGSARALAIDGEVGSFLPGREADFVVLDPRATPLLAFREARAKSFEERLFVLLTLGDDRAVAATYVAGVLQHARDA